MYPLFESKRGASTYYLTRVIFLRGLSALYFLAFLIAYQQNEGLLGNNGLLPVNQYFFRLKEYVNASKIHGKQSISPLECFLQFPSLIWFLDFQGQHVFHYMQQCALAGMTISMVIFIHGRSNAIMMIVLWLLYFSIESFGQQWYAFGWESQLLETGFIAIFLVPVLAINFHDDHIAIGKELGHVKVAIYAYWWLIFRIMIGAGLIKIRGDYCWRDLTCMDYHYETQPVPNPLSYFFHYNVAWFHRLETMVNHIVELVTPWFMFLGNRRLRLANALIQISFQLVLICSGNLSFLNWLTLLPSLTFLDDEFLLHNFPMLWEDHHRHIVSEIQKNQERSSSTESWSISFIFSKLTVLINYIRSIFFVLLIAFLSVPVGRNLLAFDGKQAMNKSFHNFKLVNTYGAFGSITKQRTEVILQGTLEDISDPSIDTNSQIEWKEYEFKCKPGNVDRRPCIISPYHYRLDWLMWFTAFGSYQQHPWLLHLTAILLSNQTDTYESVYDLLESNPFNATHPPKYIRAEHYLYEFTEPARSWFQRSGIDSLSQSSGDTGTWWTRKRIGSFFPPISLDNMSFQNFGKQAGFTFPKH